MEANTIVEGNIAIAIFMGMERTDKETGEPTFKQEKNAVVWASQLQYHTSWDWLMPVLKKVYNETECSKTKESIRIRDTKSNDYKLRDWLCLIHERLSWVMVNFDIKTAHLIAVEFIQWYNQQNIKS